MNKTLQTMVGTTITLFFAAGTIAFMLMGMALVTKTVDFIPETMVLPPGRCA